jgi:hypothetical protein
VEEAKFFGSRIIASDIDSHLEQLAQYHGAHVFRRDSVDSLVEAIDTAMHRAAPSPVEREAAAQKYEGDIKKFVSAIERALDSTVIDSRS